MATGKNYSAETHHLQKQLSPNLPSKSPPQHQCHAAKAAVGAAGVQAAPVGKPASANIIMHSATHVHAKQLLECCHHGLEALQQVELPQGHHAP